MSDPDATHSPAPSELPPATPAGYGPPPPYSGPANAAGPGFAPGPGYGTGYVPAPGYGAPGYWPPGFGAAPGYWMPGAPGPWGSAGWVGPGWQAAALGYAPAPGIVWAGVARRFGALCIDAAILFAALMAMSFAGAAIGESSQSVAVTVMGLVFWGLVLAYQPLFWWTMGGTPGQRALGMRIVRASDGLPLTIGPLLLRYAVWFGLMLLVIPAIIAAAVTADDPTKRSWPDQASGSAVIHVL